MNVFLDTMQGDTAWLQSMADIFRMHFSAPGGDHRLPFYGGRRGFAVILPESSIQDAFHKRAEALAARNQGSQASYQTAGVSLTL